MEHHYSLTTRMLAIFVGGLVVLLVLIFAAGLLLGREWGALEATERVGAAAQARARAQPAPAAVPGQPRAAAPPAPAAGASNLAGGQIRPPAPPAMPKPPALPAAPGLPALPAKSSLADPTHAAELAKSSRDAAAARPATRAPDAPTGSAADRKSAPDSAPPGGGPALQANLSPQQSATSRKSATEPQAASGRKSGSGIRGFVVYVGAFESAEKAESLAQDLRRRNLAAQTSLVEKPGRKPLVTVWVGPFDARAGAEEVLPEIRAAGLDETMIREVQ